LIYCYFHSYFANPIGSVIESKWVCVYIARVHILLLSEPQVRKTLCYQLIITNIYIIKRDKYKKKKLKSYLLPLKMIKIIYSPSFFFSHFFFIFYVICVNNYRWIVCLILWYMIYFKNILKYFFYNTASKYQKYLKNINLMFF
jgi:hypothetical protein